MGFGIGVILFSLLFLGAGIGCIIYSHNERKMCTHKASGIVVDMKFGGSQTSANAASVHGYNYSSGTYFPIIEYNGGYRAMPHSGQNPPKYKVGDRVTIYYNPNKLSQIRLDEAPIMAYIGAGFAAVGGIIFIVGIFILL